MSIVIWREHPDVIRSVHIRSSRTCTSSPQHDPASDQTADFWSTFAITWLDAWPAHQEPNLTILRYVRIYTTHHRAMPSLSRRVEKNNLRVFDRIQRLSLSLNGLKRDHTPWSPLLESTCYPSCHVHLLVLLTSEERMIEKLSIARSTWCFFDQTGNQLVLSM